MFEGIKVQNGGKIVDLNNLPKDAEGSLVLNGVDTLKIFLDGGAKYNPDVNMLENNSDVKILLTDSQGNDIFIILKNLGDALLSNNTETPVFEVFDGTETLASMKSMDDLDAAAAGGNELTSAQDGNPDGVPAFDGTDSADGAGRIDGLGIGDLANGRDPLEGNFQPVVEDVDFETNEVLGVEGAGDKNTFDGQLEVFDADPEDAGLHVFSVVPGTLSVTDTSGVAGGVIDLVGDDMLNVIQWIEKNK